MHALFCTFFPVLAVQKLLKSVNIWQSGNQMYTATFYKPRQKSRFWFFQVRCTHRSGDVVNFVIVACRISSRLKWYKKYKNWLRLAKVIVKNKMSRFFMVKCVFTPSYVNFWSVPRTCTGPLAPWHTVLFKLKLVLWYRFYKECEIYVRYEIYEIYVCQKLSK